MGVAMTRNKPLRDYKAQYGWAPYYKYGANTITGYRNDQEDRVICMPEFYKDMSYFGVFDGHGGAVVSEYLKQNLHVFISDELEENADDVELSLFKSFLTCDLSMRNITEDELVPIKDAISKEFEVPETSASDNDSSAKQELKTAIASEVVNYFHENAAKPLIASSPTFQKLFTEKIDDDDDDSDEDYVAVEESSNESEDSSSLSSYEVAEDADDDEGEGCIDPEKHNTQAVEAGDKYDKAGTSTENMDEIEENTDNSKNSSAAWKPLITGGSTATVVILTKTRAYISNVGDSRCVASVKGKAVELSKDHLPTDEEEFSRITNAGYKVKDGRIDNRLNMSRAFGDFHLKKSSYQDPFDALLSEPYISVLDINDDVDFIILASDGIWEVLSSQDVIDFINQIKAVDPVDICAELFNHILPLEITPDGSGCDNMSAIIIFFQDNKISTCVQRTENVEYSHGMDTVS